MPKKRLGAEQIVTKLRQVEVLQSQGKSVAAACKDVGLTEQGRRRDQARSGPCRRDPAFGMAVTDLPPFPLTEIDPLLVSRSNPIEPVV